MTERKSAMDMVAEAKAKIENLTVDQVAAEMDSGDPLIVDIRETEELEQHGKIPGALHAPRGMLEFYADPSLPYHMEGLDPERRVILHCAAGGRSALAVQTLQQLGYQNVAHLESGFNGWKEAGKPVEKKQLGM